MISARVDPYEAQVKAFCRRWGVADLALFGSVLRDDFGPQSDIDVVVDLRPDSPAESLLDIARMKVELEDVFGRPVDLLTRDGLKNMQNRLRRRIILDSLERWDVA